MLEYQIGSRSEARQLLSRSLHILHHIGENLGEDFLAWRLHAIENAGDFAAGKAPVRASDDSEHPLCSD